MTLLPVPTPLSPSWPLRWEAAKGRGIAHESYILMTIAAEAKSQDQAVFAVAFDAANETDPECRAEFIEELERLFEEANADPSEEGDLVPLSKLPGVLFERQSKGAAIRKVVG